MNRVLLKTPTLLLLLSNGTLFGGGHLGTHSGGWWMYLMMVGWWVVASTLLFVTWNKVIVFLTGLKEVKIWQALLVVATIAMFCYPRKHIRCHHKMKMHHKMSPHHMPIE